MSLPYNVQFNAYVLQRFLLDRVLNLVAVLQLYPALLLLLLLACGVAVVAALFPHVLAGC
jgi:hypothetical protein